MPRQRRPLRNTHKIALGGILSGACIAILFLGGLFPLSTFMTPIFAGLFLLPVFVECGVRIALAAYFAVSLLALLFVPDREVSLLFISIAGYYPFLQSAFLKIKSLILRFAVKMIYFNVVMLITYVILLYVFVSPSVQQEFAESTPFLLIAFAVLANITFVLYDILVVRLRVVYHYRIHNRFFS